MVNFSTVNLNRNSLPLKNKNQQITSFKGYAAAPLKELYMHFGTRSDINKGGIEKYLKDSIFSDGITSLFRELKQIGAKENFKVILQVGSQLCEEPVPEVIQKLARNVKDNMFTISAWAQDTKAFLKGKNGVEVATKYDQDYELNSVLGLKQVILQYVDGGNYFIGKRPDGQDYFIGGRNIIIGIDDYIADLDPVQVISSNFNIDPKQVFFIPQPNFHIDMGIRPLKGNDVLVNDYDLTVNILRKALNRNNQQKIYEMINSIKKFKAESGYKSSQVVEDSLKQAGFNTIKVPGVIRGEGSTEHANFMNAVVHQRDDGKIAYITNHCDLDSECGTDFNEIFEKTIKTIPYMDKVYFVKAPIQIGKEQENFTSYTLKNKSGGIHCLTAERPDFDRWV